MIIYFAGQDNFGNRGCEALIRSNVKTISSVFPGAEFLVPSRRSDLDCRQWPEAERAGVSFVGFEPLPPVIRWWGRLRRGITWFEKHPPTIRLSAVTQELIASSDVLILTGGDNISLDYDLESLYFWTGLCDAAISMGKPVVLWAGSVGPFSRIPSSEFQMKTFLAKLALITVRETPSYAYLRGLGLNNVEQVTDPAFALDYEPAPEAINACFTSGRQVLGFNVSPLILKFRESVEGKQALELEVVQFLADVISQGEMDVLLIPHVDPLDGSSDNSDSAYMNTILAQVHKTKIDAGRINIVPRTLNAVQIKDVIRRCTFFMGARTHATVAALSQSVPTTSIAYSVKAKGINHDLFGHTRYVLDTPDVSRETLHQHLAILATEQAEIRALLAERIPLWRERAYLSARLLQGVLQGRGK